MKIDLSLEVWVDSFKSLSRKQLAALLPHIGDEQEETKNRPIANYEFVENVQFYLHQYGNVTLGKFSIQSSWKGPVFVNEAGQKLPLAEVPPMPSNIRSFKKITINYYDKSVLGFLQEFHSNSLLTNVHLSLYCENCPKFDAMSQMMRQLLPSITSIESLTPFHCYNNNAAPLSRRNGVSQNVIWMVSHFGCGFDDWYRHWLHIPRDDGKPRGLVATNGERFLDGIHPILPFIENIKKDFLDANQAVSFFARIWGKFEPAIVQSISLTNDKTQERLVILGNDPYRAAAFVTISRYPKGAMEEWIEEVWIEFLQEKKIEVNIKSGYFACSLI